MNKTEDLKATRTIVFVSFPKASATFSTIQSLSFPPSQTGSKAPTAWCILRPATRIACQNVARPDIPGKS